MIMQKTMGLGSDPVKQEKSSSKSHSFLKTKVCDPLHPQLLKLLSVSLLSFGLSA